MLASLIVPCRPHQPFLGRLPTDSDWEILLAYGYNVSLQRNCGADFAQAEFLYFLDDDTEISSDTIRLAISLMQQDPGLAAIGGPVLTRLEAGWWERLFGAVVATWGASLHTRDRARALSRPRPAGKEDLITCNLMVRRNWFEKAGRFEPALYPGEDIDFAHRLHQCGGPMLFHPGLAVRRPRRANLWDFLTQYFLYGRSRGRMARMRGAWDHVLFFLPLLLPLVFILPRLALAYAGVCLAAGLEVLWVEGDPLTGLAACAVVPPLHLSYALGCLSGICEGRRPAKESPVSVQSWP